MKRLAFTLVELFVVIAIVGIFMGLALPAGQVFVIQVPVIFLFGWIAGIYRLVSGLQHELVALGVGVVAGIFLPFALHVFLKKMPKRIVPWTFRQSIAVSGLLCALIIATISGIALIHEIYWLTHPSENLLGSSNLLGRDWKSKQHLKMIGTATESFSNSHGSVLPVGGTMLNDGRPGHSWITQLLPYVEQQAVYDKIDLSQPWNAPENAKIFQREMLWSFHSAKTSYQKMSDEQGYQCTHYAANEHVMSFGRSLQMDAITDGTTNTILCGEVCENLKPWGSPFNSRDPGLGINRSPYGFGYEKLYKTTNFAFCDGSVKSFSEKTDPEILKALATPWGSKNP